MKYNKLTNEAILRGREINEAFRVMGVGHIAHGNFTDDDEMVISYAEAKSVVLALDREEATLPIGSERSRWLLKFSDNLGALLIRGRNDPDSIDKDIFGPEDLARAAEDAVVTSLPLALVGAEQFTPSGVVAI